MYIRIQMGTYIYPDMIPILYMNAWPTVYRNSLTQYCHEHKMPCAHILDDLVLCPCYDVYYTIHVEEFIQLSFGSPAA